MNVKLQIKQVKEETRELTVFEEALVMAVQPQTICPYYPQFVDRCKNKLRELGLSEHEDEYRGGYGEPFIWTFRTETIRNPTVDEAIAWYSIQAYNACSARVKWCSECPRYDTDDRCTVLRDYYRAVKVLENKEVIVTLTEE